MCKDTYFYSKVFLEYSHVFLTRSQKNVILINGSCNQSYDRVFLYLSEKLPQIDSRDITMRNIDTCVL